MVDVGVTQAELGEVTIVFIAVTKTAQMTSADWISLNDKISAVLRRFNAKILNGWNDDGRVSHCWQVGVGTSRGKQIRTLLEAVASVYVVDIMWAKADVSLIKGT